MPIRYGRYGSSGCISIVEFTGDDVISKVLTKRIQMICDIQNNLVNTNTSGPVKISLPYPEFVLTVFEKGGYRIAY